MSVQDLQRRYSHLNLRWNMAQMDKIKELATKGRSSHEIAFELDATSVEIERVCQRNGIYLYGKHPGLSRHNGDTE